MVFLAYFFLEIRCESSEYNTIKELKNDVSDYIDFYNHKRFHQTLGYKKTMSFYYDSLKINNKDYDNLVEIGA